MSYVSVNKDLRFAKVAFVVQYKCQCVLYSKCCCSTYVNLVKGEKQLVCRGAVYQICLMKPSEDVSLLKMLTLLYAGKPLTVPGHTSVQHMTACFLN